MREKNSPSSTGNTSKAVEDHEESKTTPGLGIGNVHASVAEEGQDTGGDQGGALTIVVVDGTNNQEADVHGGVTDGGQQVEVAGGEAEAGLEVSAKGSEAEEGAREGHDQDADHQRAVLDCPFGQSQGCKHCRSID